MTTPSSRSPDTHRFIALTTSDNVTSPQGRSLPGMTQFGIVVDVDEVVVGEEVDEDELVVVVDVVEEVVVVEDVVVLVVDVLERVVVVVVVEDTTVIFWFGVYSPNHSTPSWSILHWKS
jgi:hypothetical protein